MGTFASILLLLAAFVGGCVTAPLNPPITMKTLPADRCLPQFGPQAHETITKTGPTCVIWIPNSEMKKAQRRHHSGVAALAKLKSTTTQTRVKTEQLRAAWLLETNEAAARAVCPSGMRKAADFVAGAVTCTASLEVGVTQ